MIEIIIDYREKTIENLLENFDCKLDRKSLHIGDFIVSDRVVIERKTAKDFVSSVLDGRLFNQLIELKQFQRPILLIEGYNCFNTGREITPNAIRGALASISIDYQVPIIWTRDEDETAGFIFQAAKREQEGKKRPISIRVKRRFKTTEQEQEFLIAGLPKISTVLARRMLEELETPKKIFNASKEDLMKVKGIGKELAEKFERLLNHKYKKK